MGSRGPRPKPTALKVLQGTYRRDRAAANEPKPPITAPPCPSSLSPEAKREWRRISKQLLDLGLLSTIDHAALASYCAAYARWVEAEKKVQEEGAVTYAANGFPMMNPWLSVANKAWRQMYTMLTEFGMSPSSRSRIKAAPPKEPESKLDRFLKRGKAS